jgi:hypothetical protein
MGAGVRPVIQWIKVNDRWLPVNTVTGEVVTDLKAAASDRRRSWETKLKFGRNGPVNGMTYDPDAELPPLQLPEDYPANYLSWSEREHEDWKPRPLRGTDYEYRDEGWYRVRDGKRVYTWNERNEAVRMYRSGISATVVGDKAGIPAATIRTWARRERMADAKVWFRPRFDPT